MPGDEESALAFVSELIRRNGVSESTYGDAVGAFGEPGTVELTALVGYFYMVCWVTNVAHTPGVAGSQVPGMKAFPA